MRANLGLWRSWAYRVRWADTPQRVMRLRNTFQLVQGRVQKVATTRARLYINFGADWRSDFTAGATLASLSREAVAALMAMEGKQVRVRGWIERRNGPYVEIVHPLQIEVIDETRPEAPGIARRGPADPDAGHGLSAPVEADPRPVPSSPNEKRPEREVPGALQL